MNVLKKQVLEVEFLLTYKIQIFMKLTFYLFKIMLNVSVKNIKF